ncbi:MAG: Rieske 2Fe-2S domain-containing protein [Gemmataceae bacterium]|nr:Rieske 2Fe-2S domain-containing protein [Gemmataceae bacterium]
MAPAPAVERLPVFPASWYLFGATRSLSHGPVSRDLLGKRLVAYVTASGKPVVLDARCAHLGADLGEGCVVGDDIQCAFHHWKYGPDGRCTLVPAKPQAAPSVRQRAYPAVERHGQVFFFNGAQPLFPLPFFADAEPADYVASKPLHLVADCPWHLVNANSFDAQHFQAGHDRRPVGEPVVDCPHPFARRIRVTFEVTGDSVFDRLLRRFVGGRVDVTMTNWGGSIVVVTGDFPRTRSTLMTFIEPLDAEHCVQNVLVFARRSRLPFVNASRLWLRRLFTRGFMAPEFATLAGIRYNPGGLLDSDRLMIDFYRWIAQLPQAPVAQARSVEPRPLCEETLS